MRDKNLPLIDLHRHLDGSIRLKTILDLGQKHHLKLPSWTMEGLRPFVQVTTPQPGVMEFISKFEWLVGALVDYDACYRVAYENVEDAFREGIDYIELRFSPWFMAEPHQLDPAGVVEACAAGVLKGVEDFGVKAKIIGIISRTYGPDIAWKELEAILSQRDHVVALDLAGDEAHFPGNLFVEHFRKARDMGLRITVHAGESAGADSIWQALGEMGAERLGHGVRAVDDAKLLDYLAGKGIGIESNLTSNLQTSVVPSYLDHPLKLFLDKGIKATINSDDPGISGIDLNYEYDVAAPAAGLSFEDIQNAQRNSLEIAFLDPDERKALIKAKN
jgi:adenosine deaminase